jgi:hypothetical protein
MFGSPLCVRVAVPAVTTAHRTFHPEIVAPGVNPAIRFTNDADIAAAAPPSTTLQRASCVFAESVRKKTTVPASTECCTIANMPVATTAPDTGATKFGTVNAGDRSTAEVLVVVCDPDDSFAYASSRAVCLPLIYAAW